MRRAGLLVIALLAVAGPGGQAKDKSVGPLKVPKFIQADNGLTTAAAIRGGYYLTQVIQHFVGLDPPRDWVPPPKTAELFPDWVDAPVAMPAAFTAIGVPACGKADLSALAASLRKEPPASVPSAPQGLIHVEAPADTGDHALDSRAIYGHSSGDCLLSARE